jgi:hypothetical protein
VLTSVLIGSSLLGVVGALLAIPFAGSIQIALREVVEARRLQVRGAHEALGAAAEDASAIPPADTPTVPPPEVT